MRDLVCLPQTRLAYALILGALAALGPLCTDLYLPALPDIAQQFTAPTSVIQLTLTATLLGLGVGQLLFGPLSDSLGRRRTLLSSLVLFVVASLGCTLATDIHQLLVARLLQGIAGSGGIVLSRAIARDLYQGHELTRFYALLMMINGVAPIGAPVLGGELLRLVDWRGIFAVLTAIVLLLTLASTLQVRETLPPQQRTPGGLRQTLQQIRQLLTLRPFMGLCLAQGFTIAGMFAYIGASSFVLQQLYGLTPQLV